ncbi:MAG: hypothetical protein WAO09_04875 [Candidatus Dormiibacterota bacterium]|jgi:hypothetical protein
MTSPPASAPTKATTGPGQPSSWLPVGPYQVLAAVIVVAVVATGIALAVGHGSVSTSQRRVDFTAMVGTLRTDLGRCNAKASVAVAAWQRVSRAEETHVTAARQAQAASRACAPASDNSVWKLTLYSLPSSLDGLHLDYAISCLGVWAQEDISPAMTAEARLLLRPSDPDGLSSYHRLADWAANERAIVNATLRRAAQRLGIKGFSGIALTSLVVVSS